MIEEEPTPMQEQVASLEAMIEDGLASLGDPAVRLVPVDEYVGEAHRVPPHCYDISVDIDVGTTVLTLRLPARLRSPGSSADLVAWADLIAEHVRLALGDHVGVARIRAGEKTLLDKIGRERSDIKLLSLRPAPVSIHQPAPFTDRALRARVRMLDDALHPRIVELSGNTARGICLAIKRRIADQHRRRAAHDRLCSQNAVLEIDAAAEHAIVASGRTVAEVAHALIARRDADGCVRLLELHAEPIGFQVCVGLRHGRIVLEASLPSVRWSVEQELVVFARFPETLMAALIGRPLRAVFEHPFLPGDVEIADATARHEAQTTILLKQDTRPIGQGELTGES